MCYLNSIVGQIIYNILEMEHAEKYSVPGKYDKGKYSKSNTI